MQEQRTTPGRARRNDPTTSHLAAASVDVWPSQQAVLDELEKAGPVGRTQGELADALPDWEPSRIRSAVIELRRAGKVVDAGILRLTKKGRKAQVWMLARFEEDEAA